MKKLILIMLMFFYILTTDANYTIQYNNPTWLDINQSGLLFYHPDYIASSELVANKYCIDKWWLWFSSYNWNNTIQYNNFLLVSGGEWINVNWNWGTFNFIVCEISWQQQTTNWPNAIINQIAEWTEANVDNFSKGAMFIILVTILSIWLIFFVRDILSYELINKWKK